jgi:hypothetical protein
VGMAPKVRGLARTPPPNPLPQGEGEGFADVTLRRCNHRHKGRSMTDAELDAWINAGTSLLGIPIQPEWRAAIQLHLTITFGHANNVLAFTLPDEADPAPVFHA